MGNLQAAHILGLSLRWLFRPLLRRSWCGRALKRCSVSPTGIVPSLFIIVLGLLTLYLVPAGDPLDLSLSDGWGPWVRAMTSYPLVLAGLISVLTLSGCGAALIEWGWDEPDQAFLKAHIRAMELKPFDGVVLHLTVPDLPSHLGNFSWHIAHVRYEWDQVWPAAEELKAVPFRRFRHNFLRVNLNPDDRPLDFLDTPAWETVLANLRLAAQVVQEARLKGLMLDPEAYAYPDSATSDRPRFNLFDYQRRAVREASFEECKAAAFR